MSEQCADHWRTETRMRQDTGMGVPQIVNPCTRDACGLADRGPRVLHVDPRQASGARKNQLSVLRKARTDLPQQLDGGSTQWQAMRRLGFGVRARLDPDASVEIDIGPARCKRLPSP